MWRAQSGNLEFQTEPTRSPQVILFKNHLLRLRKKSRNCCASGILREIKKEKPCRRSFNFLP